MLPASSTAAVDQTGAVGVVEVSTFPDASMATHSDSEGQETPTSTALPSTGESVHASLLPVGSVELRTPPSSSTATHSVEEAQETPVSAWASTEAELHAPVRPPQTAILAYPRNYV